MHCFASNQLKLIKDNLFFLRPLAVVLILSNHLLLCFFSFTGSISIPRNGSCNDIICLYEAVCVQNGNTAQCICDIDCSKTLGPNSQIICGSDSNTYLSECQLNKASCLYQTRLFIKHKGPC